MTECGPQDTSNLPEILTVEEVAQLLRINPKTARELFHAGEIPGRQLGTKLIRFHRDEVIEWMRQGCGSRSRRKK